MSACAHEQPLVMRPPPPELVTETAPSTSAEIEEEIDRMADVQGDHRLPPLAGGRVERIDCKVGDDDLQARMAVEARGGQIASFAHYSKWRPRTCSLDMHRDSPQTKWRRTADGATRVQTPHGSFLIRVLARAFEFEFVDVERRRFCGMDGHTNGTMMIKRDSDKAECSVTGLLDRDDSSPELAGSRNIFLSY